MILALRDLPRTALDLIAFHDWETRLEALVQHASVLEQIMCRICFFLSEEDVQNVVAIVSPACLFGCTWYSTGCLCLPL